MINYEQYMMKYLPKEYARRLRKAHYKEMSHWATELFDHGHHVGYRCLSCDWQVDWRDWEDEHGLNGPFKPTCFDCVHLNIMPGDHHHGQWGVELECGKKHWDTWNMHEPYSEVGGTIRLARVCPDFKQTKYSRHSYGELGTGGESDPTECI